MKQKLIFLMCCAFIAALGMATFSSCGDNTPTAWSKAAVEEISSESAHTVYYDLVNPTFETVSDVVDYQDTMIEGYTIDSIFKALSPSKLKRIADVCINKSGSTDRKQIVKEYLKNISVYSNMSDPSPTASTKDDKPATDNGGSDVTKDSKPAGLVFSTEYNYYTDTVEGKPVKVQVKTEKSYVKQD